MINSILEIIVTILNLGHVQKKKDKRYFNNTISASWLDRDWAEAQERTGQSFHIDSGDSDVLKFA